MEKPPYGHNPALQLSGRYQRLSYVLHLCTSAPVQRPALGRQKTDLVSTEVTPQQLLLTAQPMNGPAP